MGGEKAQVRANNPISPAIPGHSGVNTIGTMYPNNATNRPNSINGVDLNNSLGSFPKDIQGYQDYIQNQVYLDEVFLKEIEYAGVESYRQFFAKKVIPLHQNTTSMAFQKMAGIDTNPLTAAVTGLTGWEAKWNEVASSISQIVITTNAYGRFMKKHRFADDITRANYFGELEMMFAENARITLEKLAGVRLLEGASKLYVESVDAFDPANPYAARLTLGANPSTIDAHLTWDHLQEAVFSMQNFKETYNIVNATSGAIETATRAAIIDGYQGEYYRVLVSRSGYRQLLQDQQFLDTFVIHGGAYAQDVANRSLGITSPFLQLRIELLTFPLTIEKTTDLKISTEGDKALEVAFVIGNGSSQLGGGVGIELSLEGWTKLINVGYDEDKKVDVFGLLSLTGWLSVIDFTVIYSQSVIAIPYLKSTNVKAGAIQVPTTPEWKK